MGTPRSKPQSLLIGCRRRRSPKSTAPTPGRCVSVRHHRITLRRAVLGTSRATTSFMLSSFCTPACDDVIGCPRGTGTLLPLGAARGAAHHPHQPGKLEAEESIENDEQG